MAAISLGAAVTILPAQTAVAHDFWIRPSTFTPQVDERIAVHLFVGDQGDLGELARNPAHVLRFEIRQGEVSRPIAGIAHQTPAGWVQPERSGMAALIYESRPTQLRLPAVKFEDYLREEGLEHVVAARARSGASLTEGRESFARFAKSLVSVGTSPATMRDAALGLTCELVLETDLLSWRAGEPLGFRLLFDGAPLAGRLVRLVHLERPALRVVARTDADGRARLTPPSGGAWLAAAVHMLPASPPTPEVDWESFWASVTFVLPGAISPAADGDQ